VLLHQAMAPGHSRTKAIYKRWLGHASLRTTAIYGDVLGPEERALAARMWIGSSK